MLVAVQGCSHGSLSQIYDTVAQYTTTKNRQVDLLLLCGDFQALRSEHDFPSLAVPQKYQALGTFHQYYSGEKVAPVLTIVIGGNHEASNYMWELYHGGWLSPNIYYMGAAGSLYVDGLRVVGASGIYKNHDYNKGHFEKVPYDKSALRSVYHIRQYDVAKLMQLKPSENTIMLSHDWPISIARHGDTGALLRRKPFFRDEINSNTLGSPPLFTLLNHLQPSYWFAAHLHVKFAAIFEHEKKADTVSQMGESSTSASGRPHIHPHHDGAGNPDEIAIDFDDEDDVDVGEAHANPDEIILDDDFDNAAPSVLPGKRGHLEQAGNPEEILIDDDKFDEPPPAAMTLATTSISPQANADAGPSRSKSVQKDMEVDESADLVEAARADVGAAGSGDVVGAEGVVGASKEEASAVLRGTEVGIEGGTGKEEAKDEGSRATRFLALDKCGPGKDFIQFLDIPTPPSSSSSSSSTPAPPRITYDPEWLAISRALHPYLSTTAYQTSLPPPRILRQMVDDEIARIEDEGLLVPSLEEQSANGTDGVQLVWEKGAVDVGRVQRFWATAPPHGQPGGNPNAWYTNPQTEAFCGMLGLENKVNPAPPPQG